MANVVTHNGRILLNFDGSVALGDAPCSCCGGGYTNCTDCLNAVIGVGLTLSGFQDFNCPSPAGCQPSMNVSSVLNGSYFLPWDQNINSFAVLLGDNYGGEACTPDPGLLILSQYTGSFGRACALHRHYAYGISVVVGCTDTPFDPTRPSLMFCSGSIFYTAATFNPDCFAGSPSQTRFVPQADQQILEGGYNPDAAYIPRDFVCNPSEGGIDPPAPGQFNFTVPHNGGFQILGGNTQECPVDAANNPIFANVTIELILS